MIFKKNKKISLAYNQKKIINAVGMKVLDKELSVEDANKYLVEKLGIQSVQFSKTGKIFVKIDEQNSEFLMCYDDFESQNPIMKDTVVYGNIKLTNDERNKISMTGSKVLDGEISVEEARNYLISMIGIQGVQFSRTGKIFVKIDEQNSEFLTCRSVLTENSQENYEDIRKR